MTGFTEVKSLLDHTIIPIWGDSAHWNVNKSEWKWDSGEMLKLGFFAEAQDYSIYLGTAWAWLGWEELTEFKDDKFYRQMVSTNRPPAGAKPGLPLMIRSTCNPGGVGGIWVKRRFDPVEEPKEGYILGPHIPADGQGGLSRRAVCSTLHENQRLLAADPTYLQTIIASAINAGQLEGWTTGSWKGQYGGLFENVWLLASDHFILDSIPISCIPPGWRFTAAFDWGQSSSPSALLWAAISDGSPITLPDGRKLAFARGSYVILAELYTAVPHLDDVGTGATIEEIKIEAIRKEISLGLRYQNPQDGRWICLVRRGVADSSIMIPQANRGEAAPSLADEFERHAKINGHLQRGYSWDECIKGPDSRVQGWETIRGRLHATIPPCTAPGLYITKDCPELIRTLKHMPRDLKKPNDCPEKYPDHLPDALRYILGKRSEPGLRSYSLNDRRVRAA